MRPVEFVIPDKKVWNEKLQRYERVPKKYDTEESIDYLLNYAVRTKQNGEGVAYYDVMNIPLNDIEEAILQILAVQKYYGKAWGRRMYHFVLSFKEALDPFDVLMAATLIAQNLFGYCQVLYAVHTNTEHIHVHYVLSAVRIDGRKCNFDRKAFPALKAEAERIANEVFYPSDGYHRSYTCGPRQTASMDELLADIKRNL